MKLTNLFIASAALTLTLGACSHAPTRMSDETAKATAVPPADEGYPDPAMKRQSPVVAVAPAPVVAPAPIVRDEGTTSGTTTSLGASSSGRGH